jgi:sec-independent protein translocase protein TatA
VGELGVPELLVILVIALVIFGPGKLADIGKGMGQAVGQFKKGLSEGTNPETPDEKK